MRGHLEQACSGALSSALTHLPQTEERPQGEVDGGAHTQHQQQHALRQGRGSQAGEAQGWTRPLPGWSQGWRDGAMY